MQTSSYILSLTIWVPIIAGILVLFLNQESQKPVARAVALVGSILGLLVAIPLWVGFDNASAAMQFVERAVWIPRYNIHYALGVDGISMLFVLLNSFTTILVIAASWEVIQEKVSQYLASFLIMSGLINGVFAATDAILFYLFFEAMLIPMFLIIGIWGGPRRVYAAVKFFLYTLLGSLLMLAALIYLYNVTNGSFDIIDYHRVPLGITAQTLIFLAFFASFAVKVPMWPVHTWLPDAHVEAPTGGSVILAAITLKIGAYGFLRFNMPIAPDASHALAGFMIALSLIAVVYIGLVALVQADMKKLVAYSSISHMGFVTLGFFLFNSQGVEGGLVQMISHGFISAAMFLCIGVLYDRVHSREISAYGGVVNTMPKFAFFAVLFAMANSGLPATSGFVGEFMVILGAMKVNFWFAFVASTTLILGAAYSLWMVKRVIFGEIANDNVRTLTDINAREMTILAVLALLVLFMGLYPKPFTDVMHVSVDALLKHVAISKL
ncbi:MAG: NADH-quinone oxidoreductase subunit M [Rhodocyclaceae bacterium]|nr:NADH-quinone oxidoreductase subunit M [Rhodocyclaceae bacterium]MCA3028531.1 NADH-quinone oxidoreductase subunit M [Rhodocyclaceae bacterium]MCA3032759.1 NADH-quinone oxidoreductase subunit M [Rhodocyclaceae bacterium]MCA3034589.1 NADH-quinone oxidoreductase subunit M [Rhodocyclaceae bacterium]MCA3042825.1 NADH-quinone oxidoreductase subunit M [Rhodocyclaceae bacterium]